MNIRRLIDLKLLAPWALGWYLARALRQASLRLWFKTFGYYGFRKIGRDVRIDGMPEFIVPCSDIRLGDHVRIGKRCVFQGEIDIVIDIGDNVTINDGAVITALYGIEIGSGTSIGEYSSIRDYNHKFDDTSIGIKDQGYVGSPIRIGKNVWLGRGVCVLAGVIIGDNAVIGANAVVTKSIPEGCTAVGVPAKVIRRR